MGIKASILNIFKRDTDYEKSLGVVKNGSDNLYPERVNRIINNSVTARTCSRIMATYLCGKGFEGFNDLKVDKTTTLKKFTSQIASSISKQRGVFIHVTYNANFEPKMYKVLPYMDCRLGEKDSKEYNGKIVVNKDWDSNHDQKNDVVYDVFNPDKKIVQYQIEHQKGKTFIDKVESYKGQILYYNLDESYYYALSTIDPVINDCDSEAEAGVYKNRSLRKGFFGKQMVFTKPLVAGIDDYPTPEDYHMEVTERENFKETMKDFVSAENTGGVLHVEIKHDSDSFDSELKFLNIESNIDDKIFEFTEKSTFENILMAFNSIPKGLIRPENNLFGQGKGAIEQMRIVYQDNTRIERDEVEMLVKSLMGIFYVPTTLPSITPLIDEPKEEENGTTDN